MAEPSNGLETVGQLTSKIALELVFAEPGKDNGLLPVNSLLGDMETVVAGRGLPEAIEQAVRLARHWIDAIFDRDALLDAGSLKRLGEWSNWMESAVAAATGGRQLPHLPTGWAEAVVCGAGSGAVVASKVPSPDMIPLDLNLDDGELLREFISESNEHLQNIELGVLVLEENPTDRATLDSIFRAFHTFKGGSGLLNLKPINRLAHELESLLDLARQQKLVTDSGVINIILEGGDLLKQFIIEMDNRLSERVPNDPLIIPVQNLIDRVRAVAKAAGSGKSEPAGMPAAAVAEIVVLPSAPVAVPAPELNTASILAAVKVPAEADTSTQVRGGQEAPGASGSKSESSGEGRAGGSAVVKVDTGKLDALVDLVGELVIAQSIVVQDQTLQGSQDQVLARNLAQLKRITVDLQRTAMTLRMVPIRSTFQKMHRLIRDLAAKSGKQVQLTMSGEETELDRTIVEVINDPLVHMVRNSVDHGLEKPEARLAAGKPAVGTVHLHAAHEGGNIVIEISDDGAGLNRDRILAKATERGLVSPSTKLNEKEIYDLIFAPGFSTAERVTDISGRGVGMDVVRQNVAKLRGKVEIQSTPGKGSRFQLGLPLTLAIIEGLVVRVASERYIIPSLSVRESFRPKPEMICTVQERGLMVMVRGRLIPLVCLHELFGVQAKAPDPTQAIVVVVESGRDLRCLLVDDLIGKQEVVIKSLGELFKRHEALAGATILGDGRAGLILDIGALIKWTKHSVRMAA